MQLEKWRKAFEEVGVNIAAMTYDSLDVLKKFHESEELGYPLLRDVDARHVDAFGIRDEDLGEGIPRPGMFWLTTEGRISAKFAVPGYRTRPPLAEVLASISAAVSP